MTVTARVTSSAVVGGGFFDLGGRDGHGMDVVTGRGHASAIVEAGSVRSGFKDVMVEGMFNSARG